MYAVVSIAGQQCKVAKGDVIHVPSLESAPGDQIDFDQVLLVSPSEGDQVVGHPVVDRAKVTAKVLSHGRGEKVLVFKKKRRKEYKKLNGHRQGYSEVLIEEIVMEGA